MTDWYNKVGFPITVEEAAKLLKDPDYKIVKQTKLKNGYKVSTVWLGIDHNFSWGEKQIFETMVFDKRKVRVILGKKRIITHDDLETVRYSTLQDVILGHEILVKKWRKKK